MYNPPALPIHNSKGVTDIMEKKSSVEFNKRRAEGNNNDRAPTKKFKLKDTKSDSAHSKAYLQILGNGMDTQDTLPSVLLIIGNKTCIFNAGEVSSSLFCSTDCFHPSPSCSLLILVFFVKKEDLCRSSGSIENYTWNCSHSLFIVFCSQGLQRFLTEQKIKLSKIDHIFLSRVCSEAAGGLPGLLLTLAGLGDQGMSVDVCGPPDISKLVDAMKSFIPNAAMVHTRSVADFPDPIDNEVKISAILLRPMKEKSSELNAPLAEVALDPDKAAALGLKPGPKFGQLQSGISVESDQLDIMVHPSDVMEPSVPGPIVFLVDCPTIFHLQELLSLQSLTPYYSSISEQPVEMCKKVNCVIHLSPASITSTTAYEQWMTRFGEAQHIMAGHERKNIEIPILKSSSRIAARLNYLCPKFFPAPGIWSLQQLKSLPSVSNFPRELSLPTSCQIISAENLLKFNLRPYRGLGIDKSDVPAIISRREIINELISEIPEIIGASENITQLWHGNNATNGGGTSLKADQVIYEEPWLHESLLPSCLEGITREDMEIVLLGTGSSQPSKYRNVSSIFINLFLKGSILLDCGEGTLGQLKRRFGAEGADEVVRGLRCIWISHIHADHHAGLARILSLRRDLLDETPHEPLIVVGPQQLERFLDKYQRLEDLDMQFVDCRDTTEASWEAFESNEDSDGNGGASRLKNILREAGLRVLISFPVIHCPQAYGIVLKAADRTNAIGKKIPGWKIVYSGDTRPCPELVEISRGATVLIHEATFEDGMVEQAIAKNHSTVREAVEAGDAAGAYRVILTHFSQRYPKIPVFDEKCMHKACIAFDLMSVNLADLPMLPRVLPYLKLLFRDEMVVHEIDDVDVAEATV